MNNWPNQPPQEARSMSNGTSQGFQPPPDYYQDAPPPGFQPAQRSPLQPPPQQQQPFQQQQRAEQLVRVAADLSDEALAECILSDSTLALNTLRLNQLRNKFKDVDAATFLNFLYMAQKKGADPESNEIYLIPFTKYMGQDKEREKAHATVFSYHWLMAKAISSGLVEDAPGFETFVINYFDHKTGTEYKTLCTKAWVKRKGMPTLFVDHARLPEFAKSYKGAYSGEWATKTYLMLEKCAIACVLRKAFPDVLTGMYIAAEMSSDGFSEQLPVHNEITLSPSKGAKNLFDALPAEKKAPAQVTQQFAKDD